VFDPVRDHDGGQRRFYTRLLVVFALGCLVSLALWPSFAGFGAGSDAEQTCVAIVSAWGHEVPPPSAADQRAIAALPAPAVPDPNDPSAVARFREQYAAMRATPAIQRANAYLDWRRGAGACIHESRHRLLLTAGGLSAIAIVVVGAAFVRARRGNRRRGESLSMPG
jgi:hypothetical protein